MLVFTAGYSWGQAAPKETPAKRLSNVLADLEIVLLEFKAGTLNNTSAPNTEQKMGTTLGQLSKLIGDAPKDPALTQELIAQGVRSFEMRKMMAQGAPQVTQVAAEQAFRRQLLENAQNAEIIRLLRGIAAKK